MMRLVQILMIIFCIFCGSNASCVIGQQKSTSEKLHRHRAEGGIKGEKILAFTHHQLSPLWCSSAPCVIEEI